MIKYNRRKRGTYNARTRRIHINDAYSDTHRAQRIHIHIAPHYDGYNRTEYARTIYNKTRDNSARTYVNITNTINDIFPQINAPHNAHTHRATAPYHKHIPQATDISPPDPDTQEHTIYRDTRRVKCIIFNAHNEMIHYGIFSRTRTVNLTTRTATYTLHRNKRSIEVQPYIPTTTHIHGISIQEIRAHGVEFYHI